MKYFLKKGWLSKEIYDEIMQLKKEGAELKKQIKEQKIDILKLNFEMKRPTKYSILSTVSFNGSLHKVVDYKVAMPKDAFENRISDKLLLGFLFGKSTYNVVAKYFELGYIYTLKNTTTGELVDVCEFEIENNSEESK